VRDGSELGKQAQEYMDRGDLVPDGVIIDLIAERVAGEEASDGFILTASRAPPVRPRRCRPRRKSPPSPGLELDVVHVAALGAGRRPPSRGTTSSSVTRSAPLPTTAVQFVILASSASA